MVTQAPRYPRGYRSRDWPLFHTHKVNFGLNVTDETKNSTIWPLFRQDDEIISQPSGQDVNPLHDDFAESAETGVLHASIIPKVMVDFTVKMGHQMARNTSGGDDTPTLLFNWAPIYTAYSDDYDAVDESSGSAVKLITEMDTTTAQAQGHPLFSGTKMDPCNTQVASTLDANIPGLTTTQVIESVAFDKTAYFDHLRFGTISGKLRKIMPGGLRTVVVSRNRPFHFHSNHFTNPTVKRANNFMFCGILFHMPLVNSPEQHVSSGDYTASNLGQLVMDGRCSFGEWNEQFNQKEET